MLNRVDPDGEVTMNCNNPWFFKVDSLSNMTSLTVYYSIRPTISREREMGQYSDRQTYFPISIHYHPMVDLMVWYDISNIFLCPSIPGCVAQPSHVNPPFPSEGHPNISTYSTLSPAALACDCWWRQQSEQGTWHESVSAPPALHTITPGPLFVDFLELIQKVLRIVSLELHVNLLELIQKSS